MNSLKTTFLLGLMTVLFVFVGFFIGGQTGMLFALIFAGTMNFFMYWFSDKLILKRYKATEISQKEAPELHRAVGNLAEMAGIPCPKVYLIPDQTPNAFATGRNPRHAAVAVTRGLLATLDQKEMEAVIAHELSHILNRDTLIGVIAATFAGAISYLAIVARWSMLLGGGRRRRGGNIFVMLAVSILAPLAAAIVQMAISRGREFKADRSAAKLTGRPQALASALQKLETHNKRQKKHPVQQQTATAHMFIVNPLSRKGMSKLFSTHPPVRDRVKRLKDIR